MPARRLYGQEILSIAAAYWWAVCLSFDGRLFHGSYVYGAMRGFAPQQAWAVLFLCGGTVQLLCCLWGGPLSRRVAMVGAVATWAFVATMLFMSDHLAPGVGVYVGLAILQTRRHWLEGAADAGTP